MHCDRDEGVVQPLVSSQRIRFNFSLGAPYCSARTCHPANIPNCLKNEFRLVSLDPVAALRGEAIFAPRRALRQIPLKLGPNTIPSRKLLFRHAVALQVASIEVFLEKKLRLKGESDQERRGSRAVRSNGVPRPITISGTLVCQSSYSQESLANTIESDESTIASWERGTHLPNWHSLQKLGRIFGSVGKLSQSQTWQTD